MAESTVRLTNGERWTAQDFLDHYFRPTASGAPEPLAGPPEPVNVDRSWYMDEGPGRFYHPGMFPIMRQLMDDRNLAPGTYDLRDFAPNRDERNPLLGARLSNYFRDVRSADYGLRSFVFGNESAKISGQVVVNPDGSKTFKQIEIRPWDTNFDFDHNTNDLPLEAARGIGRLVYDPENQGNSYQIHYRGPGPDNGTGRLYDPFTDSQLNAALRREFVRPGSGPPGLLPSITGKPPLPFVNEQRQYVDQTNGDSSQAAATNAPAADAAGPVNQNSSDGDICNWIASLAGVNPTDPTQPAPPPLNNGLRDFYRNDPAWLLQIRH